MMLGPINAYGYHCTAGLDVLRKSKYINPANQGLDISEPQVLHDALLYMHNRFNLRSRRSDVSRDSLAAFIHLSRHSPTFYTILQAHLVHQYGARCS